MAEDTRKHVFISYSHQDREWLDKLQRHLKPYVRNRSLSVWDDTLLEAGDKWRHEIEDALLSASVAVLLVSPHFLASDFIAENELPPLLRSAETGGLTIIWIPVSASAYAATEIKTYQAAHNPKQPLDQLDSSLQNEALVSICKKIQTAFTPTLTEGTLVQEESMREEQTVANAVWQLYPFRAYSFSIGSFSAAALQHIPTSLPIPSYQPTPADVAVIRVRYPESIIAAPPWELIRGELLAAGLHPDGLCDLTAAAVIRTLRKLG